ncbi:MAG: hypothetical protein IJ039_09685 [Clostridia bacterium]|nr:hypothetical protein [Clostridia bacterium]
MILQTSIEREKQGIDYIYSERDKNILKLMLNELNSTLNSNFQYLAELALQSLVGAGKIFVKWIEKFSSHTIKSILLQQIIIDKVKDSDFLALRLYNDFKNSNEYIAQKGMTAPAHIYVRYDNAFSKLKSQRIQNELLNLIKNPRDAFYLPFTFKMLSSKKLSELEHILISYLDEKNLNCDILGIDNSDEYYPSIKFIQRELKFSCIYGLRFYPSQNTLKILGDFLDTNDTDIKEATRKTVKYIETHKQS